MWHMEVCTMILWLQLKKNRTKRTWLYNESKEYKEMKQQIEELEE